jgi:IS1 family transposase
MKCGIIYAQKTQIWIWKAYCHDTNQLIDWQRGGRDTRTLPSFTLQRIAKMER